MHKPVMIPHLAKQLSSRLSKGGLAGLAGLMMAAAPVAADAEGTKPPASGELFSFADTVDPGRIKTIAGTAVSMDRLEKTGSLALKVDFPASQSYPGIEFPLPAGGWDLSGYAGIQVDVINPGAKNISVYLRIENNGDWKQSPWSVEVLRLNPGETKPLKVIFGNTFGKDGFALNPARISGIRFFVDPPSAPFSVQLADLRAFKVDAPSPPPAAPAPVAQAPAPAPAPPVPEAPVFPPTPLLDIAGKHDFPAGSNLNDEAAAQLEGLCSLAEFRALPVVDRHVYSFDVWPADKDSLGSGSYPFNFHLGTEGVTSQKVAFLPAGKDNILTRSKNPSSPGYTLGGFEKLDWGGNSTQVFKFNKPVTAFGMIVRSSGDVALRKFYWPSARELNGYPVTYTLADGTVIQLGKRELQGALIKGETDAFVGVIDRTGRGITSVTYSLKGMAGNKAQSISLAGLAFATIPTPAVSPVINLYSSCDFENPGAITAMPSPALPGLASLEEFRFIVGSHRHVYRFDTWPRAKPDLGSATGDFSFDLKGKGVVGEKVTVTATDAAKSARLTRTTLKNEDARPYQVLGGLGDVGKGGWAEQTFKFDKPVWGFGVTYRSPDDLKLAKTGPDGNGAPVSYTLSDGTTVNLTNPGSSGSIISGKGKTFVGLIDKTDKGISSVSLRVQGTARGPQPVYIEELAFALAGPPPGKWELTLADEFDGDKLNPAIWATGYTFPDVINNELQGYVPENVVVANGVCTIKIEQRDCVNTDRTGRKKEGIQKFASGAFTSYGKFTPTYGYFEARVKMPKARGAGIWPAFWMLPDRGEAYPEKIRSTYRTKDYGMGSEIDIFEFMPWWKRLDGLYRIHCGTIWSYGKVTAEDPEPHGYGSYALANDGWGPAEMAYPNADTEFHTYGLYWSPERLIFYVDSKPIFRVKDAKMVPDVPEYFLFNIAISENGWGASPDKKHPSRQQIIADMPNQMEIDYFRAYSGTLEEAVPAPPSDMPVIRKYSPPPTNAAVPAEKTSPVPTPAPAVTPNQVPEAPANSRIDSLPN